MWQHKATMVSQLAVGPAYSAFVPQLSCATAKGGGAVEDQPFCQAASQYRAGWTEPCKASSKAR